VTEREKLEAYYRQQGPQNIPACEECNRLERRMFGEAIHPIERPVTTCGQDVCFRCIYLGGFALAWWALGEALQEPTPPPLTLVN
jgi:hypothetical protein